jgi:3-deoxy-7-phosphoheptulonate synthase
LNFIRTALSSGIADLHRPLDWGLGHVQDPELQSKYSSIVNSITGSLAFMQTIGADRASQLQSVDLYTSHEGLLLLYEQSLTRKMIRPDTTATEDSLGTESVHKLKSSAVENDDSKAYYNTSAHFLWIGDRTRQIDGAHVEYFRGIENPIGVKVGPTTSVSDLLALLRKLNPKREVGKITLITRYGVQKVQSLLPLHIRAVEDSEYKRNVVWQCDPMHGNTRSTPSGVKTRKFGDIFSELQQTLKIHQDEGSYLGGVHLELTGEAVTECMGGSEKLDEDDLALNYTSYCDPRLNEKQALEMAFLVAGHLRDEQKK